MYQPSTGKWEVDGLSSLQRGGLLALYRCQAWWNGPTVGTLPPVPLGVQIIASSHDLGLERKLVGSGKWDALFQGNLGWWNIIPFGQIILGRLDFFLKWTSMEGIWGTRIDKQRKNHLKHGVQPKIYICFLAKQVLLNYTPLMIWALKVWSIPAFRTWSKVPRSLTSQLWLQMIDPQNLDDWNVMKNIRHIIRNIYQNLLSLFSTQITWMNGAIAWGKNLQHKR